MLETGYVLLSLFLEAMKSPFGGAKRPIPGSILREKLLLPSTLLQPAAFWHGVPHASPLSAPEFTSPAPWIFEVCS